MESGSRLQTVLGMITLKTLFLIHFTFSSCVMLTIYGGNGYLYYNSLLLLLLVYTIHDKENPEAPFLAFVVNLYSIFLDICLLIFFTYYFTFAMLLVIVHMLFRILAVIVLINVYRLRGGDDIRLSVSNVMGDGNRPRQYDDIERQPHQTVPRHPGDMGIPPQHVPPPYP